VKKETKFTVLATTAHRKYTQPN